jgi:hypothetical protein
MSDVVFSTAIFVSARGRERRGPARNTADTSRFRQNTGPREDQALFVDEAYACVGDGQDRPSRFGLLRERSTRVEALPRPDVIGVFVLLPKVS